MSARDATPAEIEAMKARLAFLGYIEKEFKKFARGYGQDGKA